MTHYEMLTVMPGTMAETEVTPLVATVKEAVEKFGGKEVAAYDMGKSRLAYPMNHIRYGYFYLTQFQADKDKINEISKKVRLVNNLLRVVIREFDPGKQRMDANKMSLTPLSNVVGVTANGDEYTSASQSRELREMREQRERPMAPAMMAPIALKKEISPVEVTTETESKKETESPVSAPVTTVAPALSMEDIDAQLDKILEHDLEKV
ncbi:MAG: 30S ribosomal protein S6 [Patescibacteria group bacterium]